MNPRPQLGAPAREEPVARQDPLVAGREDDPPSRDHRCAAPANGRREHERGRDLPVGASQPGTHARVEVNLHAPAAGPRWSRSVATPRPTTWPPTRTSTTQRVIIPAFSAQPVGMSPPSDTAFGRRPPRDTPPTEPVRPCGRAGGPAGGSAGTSWTTIFQRCSAMGLTLPAASVCAPRSSLTRVVPARVVCAAMPSRLFAPGVLDGQVAIVSGGGSGLGRASALELAACGARRWWCADGGSSRSRRRWPARTKVAWRPGCATSARRSRCPPSWTACSSATAASTCS